MPQLSIGWWDLFACGLMGTVMSSGHDCKDCNERYNACKCVKPPIGLMPESIWKWQRRQDISNAMDRYMEAGMDIPSEWYRQLKELQND